MKTKHDLPPRWIGAALIATGIVGLVFVISPRSAAIALAVVVSFVGLIGALLALVALAVAERADEQMGITEEQVEESAKRYADALREQLRGHEAEITASAVIADDDFPTGVPQNLQHKGGDTRTAPPDAPVGTFSGVGLAAGTAGAASDTARGDSTGISAGSTPASSETGGPLQSTLTSAAHSPVSRSPNPARYGHAK